ncbi:hypothetical protein NPIL_198531 [Nephila pilipes]|uniref:Uncharacterized protein n=1 Tax=Nephila pilipes TaxID=299642 RepID=A0A8X6PXF8_NEPPI|nr:hypothetical protein NPIL_198531 [Nephila pilipes]
MTPSSLESGIFPWLEVTRGRGAVVLPLDWLLGGSSLAGNSFLLRAPLNFVWAQLSCLNDHLCRAASLWVPCRPDRVIIRVKRCQGASQYRKCACHRLFKNRKEHLFCNSLISIPEKSWHIILLSWVETNATTDLLPPN